METVRVVYGRKLNLGDFNSAHIEFETTVEVEEGDDLDGLMRALCEMVGEDNELHANVSDMEMVTDCQNANQETDY